MEKVNTPNRATFLVCVAAALLAACSNGAPPLGSADAGTAQQTPAISSAQVSSFTEGYQLLTLPPLSGDGSHANSINDRGRIAGDSTIQGSSESRAALWMDGRATDIGTLGHASCVCWPVKTNRDELAVTSQTKHIDPLREDFCSNTWSTPYVCLGFRSSNGTKQVLPTLGGNNDQAAGENDTGHIVGVAETATRDPACAAPQTLDYDAAIWQADGRVVALAPLSGDTVSQATAVNDGGDVVGSSGTCGPPYTIGYGSTHAVIWHNDLPADIGNLGGTTFSAAFAINDRGDIAGASTLSDNVTIHAFFRRHGVMTDLGTLPGDAESIALGLNDDGGVVGISCDSSGNCRGFVWNGTSMSDLNQVVAHGSNQFIMNGQDINDRGWIVGQVYNAKNGHTLAYVAVPHTANAPNVYSRNAVKVTFPEAFRMQVLRRTTFRPYLRE